MDGGSVFVNNHSGFSMDGGPPAHNFVLNNSLLKFTRTAVCFCRKNTPVFPCAPHQHPKTGLFLNKNNSNL